MTWAAGATRLLSHPVGYPATGTCWERCFQTGVFENGAFGLWVLAGFIKLLINLPITTTASIRISHIILT
jgi:hypothetical protein